MAIGMLVLLTVIALPLVVVWKQAYIASTSMRIEAMNDTVSAMNRHIAGLEIVSERLSSNERIEAVARAVLKLDYPASDRITVIPFGNDAFVRKPVGGVAQLLAAVQNRPSAKEAGE
jgi:cell division protein FtsL